MDIHGQKVQSQAFGGGVITGQSESTITVGFQGGKRKFLYPSCFEEFLTAEDPAVQKEIHSEIASGKATQARKEHLEKRRALIQAEQQKIEARKTTRKTTRKKK